MATMYCYVSVELAVVGSQDKNCIRKTEGSRYFFFYSFVTFILFVTFFFNFLYSIINKYINNNSICNNRHSCNVV